MRAQKEKRQDDATHQRLFLQAETIDPGSYKGSCAHLQTFKAEGTKEDLLMTISTTGNPTQEQLNDRNENAMTHKKKKVFVE